MSGMLVMYMLGTSPMVAGNASGQRAKAKKDKRRRVGALVVVLFHACFCVACVVWMCVHALESGLFMRHCVMWLPCRDVEHNGGLLA